MPVLAACSGPSNGGGSGMISNRTRGITASAALAFLLAALASFLRKGAGLINQVEQSVLKRLPDVSY